MSAITKAFERCRAEKRAAFIPFLMAGDPHLETTREMLYRLVRAGADVIELGVPFSDPIADGPVNQRAAVRALESHTTVAGILRLIAEERDALGVPIVLFSYLNPLLARGAERFAEQAGASGVDGVLAVDLPPEEAAAEFAPALEERGVDSIVLLAPTSSKERVKQAAATARGFVYYVSRAGVTGVREALPEKLTSEVKSLRRRLALPVAVGFGISTPEQAAAVARVADGVVVGSALVRLIEENPGAGDLPAIVEELARDLAGAMVRKRGLKGLVGR